MQENGLSKQAAIFTEYDFRKLDLPSLAAVSLVGTACVWAEGTSSFDTSHFGETENVIN